MVYKDREQIISELIANLQARLPDANVGVDSAFRIMYESWAPTVESLFLALQLLHDDMFPQTASALALMRDGELWGRPIKGGVAAIGTLRFSGVGGTTIPEGTLAAAPSSSETTLRFATTDVASIPAPGLPAAPVAADGGAGSLVAGTYEYAVTFTTALGETAIGAVSNALILAVSHQTNLTAIPLGGTGTVGRKVYRRKNGGVFALVTTLANNTATSYTDTVLDASLGGPPPSTSTAEQVDIAAAAEDVGIEYNVGINTVTTLSDSVTGVTSVTNPVAFAAGGDQEDIEVFRSELLEFIRAPKSGSPADLEAWAEAIDGVETATAFTNDNLGVTTNGHTTVRITGPGGTVPGSTVIVAVLAELQSHDLANITIHVATFTPHPVSPTVTITPATGYLVADIHDAVVAAISDYITSVPVGGTVYEAGIKDAVFGLPGVATLTTSFTDTATASTEKATPGTITVS